MATHRVDVVKIQDIEAHPNADRLDIAYPFGKGGWPVVVQKHRYATNDLVIYCPVDSILPQKLEERLFPSDSKIRLHRSRIRAIKIRSLVSQGMIIDPSDVHDMITPEDITEGADLSDKLGITKYEPPVDSIPETMRIRQAKKIKPDLKLFRKYTDVQHGKYWTREIRPGDQIVITTKLHGTSFRAGWFKTEANTWWQKTLKFVGLLPEWTFAWGSRNMQIQAKLLKKHPGVKIDSQGVDFGDVYTKMVNQYDLRNRIPKGMAIYGEIVGWGIQKGYNYGCGPGEHKLYLYDIAIGDNWLDYYPNPDEEGRQKQAWEGGFADIAHALDIPTVPIMHIGAFSWEKLQETLALNPISTEVNEGVVIRPLRETKHPLIGRVVLKFINDEYYMQKDGTDFH